MTHHHRQNASLELPTSLIVEAIHLARTVSFHDGAEFGWGRGAGNCERHPAMRMLTDWWNATAPQDFCTAAFAATFVSRNGEYLCPCPDMLGPAMVGQQNPDCAARVGDHLLIQFVRSYANGARHGAGWRFFDVGGALWLDVAVADDERDEAYYCLVALAKLPDAFPDTWRTLNVAAASAGLGRLGCSTPRNEFAGETPLPPPQSMLTAWP